MGKEFRPVTLEELEGKRRKDIEENLQKQDMKRQKIQVSSLKPFFQRNQVTGYNYFSFGVQARNNAPAQVAKNLAMHEVDPLQGRRSKMMLPAPQISEAELEVLQI